MVRRAAEAWGFSETEMDDFDPLVILLMEACAVEIEKIAGEIGSTRRRMMDRLAKLLYPGIISMQPAYGVIQMVSSEPSAVLRQDSQFTCKPLLNDRKRDSSAAEIYFSPVVPTRIVDGAIRYIATSRELFEVEEGIQKRSIATAPSKRIEWQHTLWLGIALNEEVATLEDISFFFNWLNEPESDSWYPYLPYTQWSLSGFRLQHTSGLPCRETDDDTSDPFIMEFDAMKKIERSIGGLFSRHYLSLWQQDTLEHMKVRRMPYPAAFVQLYDGATLKILKEPLLWMEVRFPEAVPTEALETVVCSMNAVPMLNRRLNRMTYKLGQTLNIIPLETEDFFLSVNGIVNGNGQRIKASPSGSEATEGETYTLRYGINRFDERDAYETLVNLTEIIKEESSFFSSLGEDFMIHNIRELKQVLARLEEKLKMQQRKQSPYPYLMVRAATEGTSISIEFWSCNGEIAGRIPVGSRLLPYKNSHVRTQSLYFITPTYGGRDKFNDAAKIDHYKQMLLTHDRIVTQSDLQIMVRTELGRTARKIEYKKAYMKSPYASEGFIRCMQIIITPEPGSFDSKGWQQRLRELQQVLENKSVNNIPFQLLLLTPEAI